MCYYLNVHFQGQRVNLAIRCTMNWFWKLNVDADVTTGGGHRDCLWTYNVAFRI